MQLHWQTALALGIVAVTLVIFIIRWLRPRKQNGCGHGCDCRKP